MSTILQTSRIAIIGLGQLGTSLALRIKELGCRELLAVSRRPESLQQAVDREIIDAGSTEAADILPVVDLAFLCLPLSPSIDFVNQNLAHFRFGGLVTDVGSVKAPIVNAVRGPLWEKGVHFVGSHPMAGSEKSGMESARSDLYQNAVVFLTPTPDDDEDAVQLVSNFWSAIGAIPYELSAERHDQACAFSSHLLHMLAASIVKSVLGRGDNDANLLACAGGFRDVTRIASSNVGMWTDICRHNTEPILRSMDTFMEEVQALRDAIQRQDWAAVEGYLVSAKGIRDGWFEDFGKPRGYRR